MNTQIKEKLGLFWEMRYSFGEHDKLTVEMWSIHGVKMCTLEIQVCVGIEIHTPGGGFYQDEAAQFAALINRSLELVKERNALRKKEWMEETQDQTEWHGMKLDMSRREGVKTLQECSRLITGKELRIHYKNKWLRVCRTDLKDDVCTTSSIDPTTMDEAVKYWTEKIVLGVRLKDDAFCCVDAYSDG